LRYHSASAMRAVLLRFVAMMGLGLLLFAAALPSRAQDVDSFYGPLPVFEFHSGFWVNLHHFLYHEARLRQGVRDARNGPQPKSSGPVLKQTAGPAIALSPSEQKLWDEAVAYYLANLTMKDLQVNIDLILLKDQLGEFEDCDELTGKKKPACDAGLPGKEGTILESVSRIYRTHWWTDQDRENRRWVLRVAPLVREQGVGLSERLAEIYQSKWPKEKIHVDVCAFANASGAYTTLDPLRVTIASTDPRNQGSDALEVLFHESSHGLALPVQNAITRECRQREKPIPRNLWHALIYYTTDEVLLPVLQGTEADPNSPASTSSLTPKNASMPEEMQEDLTQRGWENYLSVLTTYWQPYLDGKVKFDDAIAHMVSAI
jgi:hypothetical protein